MGRPPIYPWSEWFQQLASAGSSLELEAGRDFQVPLRTMRGAFLNEAKRRGFRVKTAAHRDGTALLIIPVLRNSYPWDTWLDGRTHVLTWGRDFDVTVVDMQRTVRRAAKNRGLVVATKTLGDMLQILALPKRPARVDIHDRVAARIAAEQQREDDEFAAYDAHSNAFESQAVRSDVEP